MINEKEHETPNEIRWEIRVPILKNGLILKQLGLGIGIPFGILMLIFVIIEAYYGLILVGITVVVGLLLALIIFRGTYDAEYILDQKGIVCRNQENQKKRVKKLSAVTFWLGLFSRNYTAAGAGVLSGASTEIKIPWKRIRKVKFNDKQMTIMVKGGFGENIALFCTEENHLSVKQMVQTKTNR